MSSWHINICGGGHAMPAARKIIVLQYCNNVLQYCNTIGQLLHIVLQSGLELFTTGWDTGIVFRIQAETGYGKAQKFRGKHEIKSRMPALGAL
jgi:hypothetical protein